MKKIIILLFLLLPCTLFSENETGEPPPLNKHFIFSLDFLAPVLIDMQWQFISFLNDWHVNTEVKIIKNFSIRYGFRYVTTKYSPIDFPLQYGNLQIEEDSWGIRNYLQFCIYNMNSKERDSRTHAIIGATMEVHKEMGPGFLEVTLFKL